MTINKDSAEYKAGFEEGYREGFRRCLDTGEVKEMEIKNSDFKSTPEYKAGFETGKDIEKFNFNNLKQEKVQKEADLQKAAYQTQIQKDYFQDGIKDGRINQRLHMQGKI